MMRFLARRFFAQRVGGRPARAFLLSLTAHLVGLLPLLCLVTSNQRDRRGRWIVAQSPPAAEELEEFTVDLPPPDLEPDVRDSVAAALGAAAVGDPGKIDVVDPAAIEIPLTAAPLPVQSFTDRPLDSQPGGVQFFGVRSAGRCFCFVIDSSRSMRGGRFEAACREVAMAVRRMKPNQKFFVLFFDGEISRMTFNGTTVLHPLRANADNVRRLEEWMASITLETGNQPQEALAIVLQILPDAVFLLTDGRLGSDVEEFLRVRNRSRDLAGGFQPRVIVHTVGFYSRAGEDLLKRIAEQHGGSYRFVPPPRASAGR